MKTAWNMVSQLSNKCNSRTIYFKLRENDEIFENSYEVANRFVNIFVDKPEDLQRQSSGIILH